MKDEILGKEILYNTSYLKTANNTQSYTKGYSILDYHALTIVVFKLYNFDRLQSVGVRQSLWPVVDFPLIPMVLSH